MEKGVGGPCVFHSRGSGVDDVDVHNLLGLKKYPNLNTSTSVDEYTDTQYRECNQGP